MKTLVRNERPLQDLPSEWSLSSVGKRYRGRLFLTYFLFCIENLLRLAQPLALGLAINDLLQSSTRGLWIFLAQHLSHLVVGTARQMYDTRTFTRIASDLATQSVTEQRGKDVPLSQVAARSTMSRGYVEFLEREVPMMVRAAFSVLGALAFLAWFDLWLVPMCLALAVPAWLLNSHYGRKTFFLNGQLHDEYEKEVEIIERGDPDEVKDHYDKVNGWRIRLSDWEAWNFGAMELFVLAMLAGVLFRVGSPEYAAGDIFAIFRYVMLFLMGLDSVPRLVAQLSRIRDIGKRLG